MAQTTEADIRRQVMNAAGAFLQACGSGQLRASATPLWIDVALEGAWPFDVDVAAILRVLAGDARLVCHTSYRSAFDASTPRAILLRALNAPGDPNVRHVVFLDDGEAPIEHREKVAARAAIPVKDTRSIAL
jgi:hypothetical protein